MYEREATASAKLSAGAGLSPFEPCGFAAFRANNGALPRYPARALRALNPQFLEYYALLISGFVQITTRHKKNALAGRSLFNTVKFLTLF